MGIGGGEGVWAKKGGDHEEGNFFGAIVEWLKKRREEGDSDTKLKGKHLLEPGETGYP